MSGKDLTHIDDDGRARMVDITHKAQTHRRALAQGQVRMSPDTLKLALSGGHKKGDVKAVAEIAGVMAAKKCSEIIPMCHPIALSKVKVSVDRSLDGTGLTVTAEAIALGPTGVEMEALTAVSASCLTLYDMLKSAQKDMVIDAVQLLEKSGGASGDYVASDGVK